MRRAAHAFTAAALVALSALAIAGSASAVPAPVGAQTASVVPVPALPATRATAFTHSTALSASADDFEFESFAADYYLSTDADGRSTLTTVETFVANFPEFDQNHGMRRAIPEDYQGAPTDVAVQSVTDEHGNPRPFGAESDGEGFLVVTSADRDFVHGRQSYVFTYTQRNVTRYFPDTDSDEFYWDTNGTGWSQYFGSVTARVHVPAALVPALNGKTACYRGYEGSTDTCEIATGSEDGGVELSTSVAGVYPNQNITVAVGFAPHTFVERDDSYLASPFAILQVLSVLAGVAAMIWAIVLRATTLADRPGRLTVIAEYEPPKGVDIFTASVILRKTPRAAAAQFLGLAVDGRIRIIDSPKTGLFAHGSTWAFELVSAAGLEGPALELTQSLFGPALVPGTRYDMKNSDPRLSRDVRSIIRSATSATTTLGLRARAKARYSVLPTLLVVLSAVGAFVSGVALLDAALGGPVPLLLFVPPVIAAVVVFALVFRTPLTERGAELRDHLKGLELYIRLAEADRLRMLQSPSGSLREGETEPPAGDRQGIVRVYEKLLPYAVLFKLEQEWAEELGRYYVDESPGWYSGSGAFNAAVFASSVSALSSAAASSYSGSSSSSSSGGSGGGGSSGGGGGGGGGGGV